MPSRFFMIEICLLDLYGMFGIYYLLLDISCWVSHICLLGFSQMWVLSVNVCLIWVPFYYIISQANSRFSSSHFNCRYCCFHDCCSYLHNCLCYFLCKCHFCCFACFFDLVLLLLPSWDLHFSVSKSVIMRLSCISVSYRYFFSLPSGDFLILSVNMSCWDCILILTPCNTTWLSEYNRSWCFYSYLLFAFMLWWDTAYFH